MSIGRNVARLALAVAVVGCSGRPSPPAPSAPVTTAAPRTTAAPPQEEPEPPYPEEWRADAAVSYSCREPDDHSCTEWLVTNPRAGSPAEAYCAKDQRVEAPCPTDDVVAICDESNYFGTLEFSYAPNESGQAQRVCRGRFWPSFPARGAPATYEDPPPPPAKDGCSQAVPPPLGSGRLCLDLPPDLKPARFQDPRYDPPLNPPPGRTIIGQFTAGFHQVFVYRRAPMRLEPACPETPQRRGTREAQDANFIQVETTMFVEGEWLEVACLSPASIPAPARRMCGEGVLRWCTGEDAADQG